MCSIRQCFETLIQKLEAITPETSPQAWFLLHTLPFLPSNSVSEMYHMLVSTVSKEEHTMFGDWLVVTSSQTTQLMCPAIV
ncbi:uncharacterized [Tachysurus ichikawai]